MACNHKFKSDLYLSNLDFKPETLIVGTFNPEWPAANTAQWFYGRTHDEDGNQNNNFWDVLPRLYEEETLINAGPKEWRGFCRKKRIAITDLIASIDDAEEGETEHQKHLGNYSDKNIATKFKQHSPTKVDKILENHPSISNVYLTRGTGEIFWRNLWQPVVEYAGRREGIREATLLTPSGYAFYQQSRYNKKNREQPINALADFILYSWEQQWHF